MSINDQFLVDELCEQESQVSFATNKLLSRFEVAKKNLRFLFFRGRDFPEKAKKERNTGSYDKERKKRLLHIQNFKAAELFFIDQEKSTKSFTKQNFRKSLESIKNKQKMFRNS